MTVSEFLLRIYYAVRPLVPYMLIAAAATLAVLALLLAVSRNYWVDRRSFRWLGVFYGLDRAGSLRLACAWLKLLMLVFYLVSFQKLEVIHYLAFLLTGLFCALDPRGILQIPGNLLSLLMEAVGLLTANLICGYVRDMEAGWGYVVVYILVSAFVTLYGVYLFLTELNSISSERRTDFDRVEKTDT